MRTNPHVLEINARAWIEEIKRETGQYTTLAEVPEHFFADLKELGFDAIWLMGVWLESPASRDIARNEPDINALLQKAAPGYSKDDIIGSQYSIYGYQVNPVFGGDEALLKFKKRLNDYGISLFLDFAGNHFAKDHPLTLTEPDLFIHSKKEPADKNLFFQTKNGDWLAHGRDPHYPPWTDTVQLNLFNPKTRALLMEKLLKLTDMCDGLRCDMVMLMLNKIFKGTWGQYVPEEMPHDEFWPGAIRQVKAKSPGFSFLAEVYWGLEWEVQESGFDYTYDKTLYDRLLMSTPQDIAGHLHAEHLYQKRSIRFISNHDEQAPITAFGRAKSKAAAVAAATITGMRLFTMQQLRGDTVRLPIQYLPKNMTFDKDIFAFYKRLLAIINHPCFHGGQWVVKHPRPVDEKDMSANNILAWEWTQFTTCKIVLVNYSDKPARCYLSIGKVPAEETLLITEEFTNQSWRAPTATVKTKGLKLDFAPYECKILSSDFC